MLDFLEYDINKTKPIKKGGKVKHEWLRQMGVAQAYPIPNDLKIGSVRVMVSLYAKETGKKFRVSTSENLVIRIA